MLNSLLRSDCFYLKGFERGEKTATEGAEEAGLMRLFTTIIENNWISALRLWHTCYLVSYRRRSLKGSGLRRRRPKRKRRSKKKGSGRSWSLPRPRKQKSRVCPCIWCIDMTISCFINITWWWKKFPDVYFAWWSLVIDIRVFVLQWKIMGKFWILSQI